MQNPTHLRQGRSSFAPGFPVATDRGSHLNLYICVYHSDCDQWRIQRGDWGGCIPHPRKVRMAFIVMCDANWHLYMLVISQSKLTVRYAKVFSFLAASPHPLTSTMTLPQDQVGGSALKPPFSHPPRITGSAADCEKIASELNRIGLFKRYRRSQDFSCRGALLGVFSHIFGLS